MDDEPIEEEPPMSLRPYLITGGVLALLVCAGAGAVWWKSEQVYTRTHDDVPPVKIQVPLGDSEAIAEGERLGVVHGCVGCHTKTLGGKVAFDNDLYQLNSANLTKGPDGIGNIDTDGMLARAIRYGVRHDGRGVLGMPSATLFAIDDVDLSLIIAWVRSKAPVPTTLPPHTLRWKGRWEMATGHLHSVGDSLFWAPKAPKAPPYGATMAYGQYLARTICAECHGARLEGTATAPGLAVVAGYDSTEFINAIIYGQARDGRLLKRTMPIERYDALNPEERTALYMYLHSLHGPASW